MLHHKYTIHYLLAVLTAVSTSAGSVGLMHGSVHLAGALCTGNLHTTQPAHQVHTPSSYNLVSAGPT
jgi:hypothetical protein